MVNFSKDGKTNTPGKTPDRWGCNKILFETGSKEFMATVVLT